MKFLVIFFDVSLPPNLHKRIESRQVIVEAEDYEPQAKLVEVAYPSHGPAQRLDFDLAPIQVSCIFEN